MACPAGTTSTADTVIIWKQHIVDSIPDGRPFFDINYFLITLPVNYV